MVPPLFARLLAGGAPASSSGPASTSPHPTTRAPRPNDRATLQIGGSAFDATVSLRVELWMSVLHRAGGAGAHASQAKYDALLERGCDAETLALISKDATRTFPALPRSALDPAALRRVLIAYAALDPSSPPGADDDGGVGYAQGLNFVAAVLLIHVKSERAAFGLLAILLLERGLRALYVDGMAALQLRLSQLQLLLEAETARPGEPSLGAHLESVCAPTVLWAAPWFLTCFASSFPIGVSARCIDVLLRGTPIRAPVLAIARAFARCASRAVLSAGDMETAVAALRDGVPRLPEATLNEMMTEALASSWSGSEAVIVERVDEIESVVATVDRLSRGEARATTDEEAGASPSLRARPSLKWAEGLASPSAGDGRLPLPPQSPGGGRSASVPSPPRAPTLARVSLVAAASLRRADAALPPADVAGAFYDTALAAVGGSDAAAPPAIPSAAVSVDAPPPRPLLPRRASLHPSGGSDDWGAFAAAADAAPGEASVGATTAALDAWGPYQSVDGEPES